MGEISNGMKLVLVSILSMVGLGAFFAVVLAVVDKKLGIKEDARVRRIAEVLPGGNCGACGFGGCHAFAEAAIEKAGEIVCPVAGEEASKKIATILGIEHMELEKKIAVIHCGVKEPQRKRRAKYQGIRSCQAIELLNGGDMECGFGCLGYGDCVRACPFGALEMSEGKPEVIIERCTACGKCIESCPRNIISLKNFDRDKGIILIACSSEDKGAVVKKICEVGCIGCGLCVKVCPEGCFELKENLARVDYEKLRECKDWNKAIKMCPTQCIVEVR